MCARIVDTQFKVDSSSSSSSDQLSLPVLKVACLDQLDKSDTPSVPDNYAGGLALSILLNVVDGMSARVLPVFFEGGNQPSLVDGVIAPSLSAEQRESVKEIGEMVVACWPSVLQAISALLNRTSPNDEAFNMVLFKAVQNIATLSGVLGLEAPRDAFLAALRKYALPANDDGQVIESTAAYSEKNFQVRAADYVPCVANARGSRCRRCSRSPSRSRACCGRRGRSSLTPFSKSTACCTSRRAAPAGSRRRQCRAPRRRRPCVRRRRARARP